ncbi:EF-hand domain-containing protein [Maliponia aquimaris]|uniref:EF hand n=1 Tax=Maliponia aquimaris TaxID=1673631 RepID=A0A238KD24_9RHOB|nr:EF-hand domain-containing protein [Maliponia aquimaris]SMX40304.1 EF hand [Maliponia aquimaris]
MLKHISLALLLAAAPALAQQGQPGGHFVQVWDIDGDGKVTVDEATERRGDIFASFDANEDGFLDAEEYVLFDEARNTDLATHAGGPGGGAMMRAADGMLLERNDTDGDGKVSLEEFLGQVPAWVAAMDRTGDGVVTTDDFGPGAGN